MFTLQFLEQLHTVALQRQLRMHFLHSKKQLANVVSNVQVTSIDCLNAKLQEWFFLTYVGLTWFYLILYISNSEDHCRCNSQSWYLLGAAKANCCLHPEHRGVPVSAPSLFTSMSCNIFSIYKAFSDWMKQRLWNHPPHLSSQPIRECLVIIEKMQDNLWMVEVLSKWPAGFMASRSRCTWKRPGPIVCIIGYYSEFFTFPIRQNQAAPM